ncbi:unnamed protein product [Vitrella brassicaformis CCMP3155]|uniref:Uncharacterized protein n=2 Tax=Vitrella brassicaformis TaxID=1169539 RepID=A0A0G4EHB9_VITBC|nr:unnamed protein product [Vitrella brassicaformis CCMP3155]|eukprot:CEL94908.1 unnamed protein product [Vitrella brassicaformis CCMP3155]
MSKKTQADPSKVQPSHPVGLDSDSSPLSLEDRSLSELDEYLYEQQPQDFEQILRSVRPLMYPLNESIHELHHRVQEVLQLCCAAASSSQAQGSASERVGAQRAVLLGLVRAISVMMTHKESTDPFQMFSAVQLANAKCDLITAMIEQPALFVSPLVTLPESCFTRHIGPFLDTKDIITRLALTHPYLHTASRKPAMHETLRLGKDFNSEVEMTEWQVSAWGPACSQTKKATMVCLPGRGVLTLLEHASSTLEQLHAWSDAQDAGRATKPKQREGGDELVFPKLTRVEVAGWWICVANRRRWKPTSLVDVHLRDMNADPSVRSVFERMCSGNGGAACTAWLAGPGPHNLTLELRWHGWHLRNLQNLLKPSVKRLSGVWGHEMGRQKIAVSGLQLEEFHTIVIYIYETELESLDAFRAVCMAPNGTINFTCRANVRFDVMRELRYLEAHPSWSDILINLAAAVKTVVFPSGLARWRAVPRVVLHSLPQLVFSKTESLQLSSVGLSSDPLPDPLLSGLSDSIFPNVTTIDLGQTEGGGSEQGHHSQVAERGPLLHVKAKYAWGSNVCFDTGVWSLWEGGGGGEAGSSSDGRQRGMEGRVRKISVDASEEDESGGLAVLRRIRVEVKKNSQKEAKETAVGSEGEPGVLPVCLQAIGKCPLLNSIALDYTLASYSVDQLGSDTPLVQSQLLSRGFLAVQTNRDTVELCRVFGCLFPHCLSEHVSDLSPSAVYAPRVSMDDTVSLSEAVLAHAGLHFPRCVSPHLDKEWERRLIRCINIESRRRLRLLALTRASRRPRSYALDKWCRLGGLRA